MSLQLLPSAWADIFEATDWYDEQEPGLGSDFEDEVLDSLDLVLEFPSAFQIVGPDVRRCLVNRFPFAIYYVVDRDKISVLAVTHTYREHGHWRDRL